MRALLDTVAFAVVVAVVLLLPCLVASGLGEEKAGGMDSEKRIEDHQKRAETLRHLADSYAESSRKADCPAEKAKTLAEVAGLFKEMASMNDRAVEDLRKNDKTAYEADGQKFKALEERRRQLFDRLGWNVSGKKEPAPSAGAASAEQATEASLCATGEEHRRRASDQRSGAEICINNSKRSDMTAEKAKAFGEIAPFMFEMADLHEQAADAIQKDDPVALKKAEARLADLEPRKRDFYRRLDWVLEKKPDRSASAHSQDGRKASSPSPSSAGSVGSSSTRASAQPESELQRWLGEDFAK
jgi:hypothetical protein